MRESIIAVSITAILFYIISLVIDHRTKNFIYEKQNMLFNLIMFISIYSVGEIYRYKISGYYIFIHIIIVAAVLGGRLAFQKNKIYFFKGIDKRLVKENKYEIIQIIDDYKTNYTGANSDITLAGNKIVFEEVSKEQTEECLSLVGSFLDENRGKYSYRDYLIYIIKGHIIPLSIIIAVMYMLFRLTA